MSTPAEPAREPSQSKKRKAKTQSEEPTRDPTKKKAVRIQAVPGYESFSVQPLPGLEKISEDHEVWLLQLPLQVPLSSLKGGFIELDEECNDGLVGQLNIPSGPSFQLVAARHAATALVALQPTAEGALKVHTLNNHISLLPGGLLPAPPATPERTSRKSKPDGSGKKKSKRSKQAEGEKQARRRHPDGDLGAC